MNRIRLPLWLALAAVLFLTFPFAAIAAGGGKRSMTVDDLLALRDVRDPSISPEGDWVAYTVRSVDLKEDKRNTDIWMTSWDGSRAVPLTSDKENETTPRWSPDGKSLAFLSSRRVEGDKDQVWLLDRAGGEARQITELKGDVEDLAWSPDGKRIALVVQDPEQPEAEADKTAGGADKPKKTPRPIVLDRFQFKQDIEGYLDKRRRHIVLLDVEARKTESLTSGDGNELLPSWSPDGSTIAFVSKISKDIDRDENFDIFVVEAHAGAKPRAVTTWEGADCAPDWDSRPAWSPDGKMIAYPRGGKPSMIEYAVHQLAVIPVAGGPERLLSPTLDRNVENPRWSADGAWIWFLLEEDRATVLAKIRSTGGAVERVASGPRQIGAYDMSRAGRIALLSGTPQEPMEVFALDGTAQRRLTSHNKELIDQLALAPVEETSFKSKDGTEIHGFLTRPPDARPGAKLPALLRIHGGPQSQFTREFNAEWQVLAAAGYAVIGANPRGSTGRGETFAMGIFADWGNKDAQDVLAAVDDAVSRGIADPDRLGLGGWSYGGILTNYVIAQDRRFKAATSGASISNILAGYGTDQYVRDYEAELGRPWEHPDVWLRVSFPFYHADRITTPTLFLCGEKDFNVPLLNSEQMYQALRSLGVDTQLVIYPGQFHGFTRPSFIRDRMQRYLDWYARHIPPAPAPPPSGS